jgi:very-short-patch-repair endonuclease
MVVVSPERRTSVASKFLPDRDLTFRDGFPVTSVARTILDLARSFPEAKLRSLLVEAERQRIFDRDSLLEVSSRGSGWSGARKLRRVLVEWDLSLEVTKSVFEEKFLSFCRSHRLPMPAVNAKVIGFEVDCFWESTGLIVELDGFATHSDLKSFDGDRRRDAILLTAGLDIRRVTYRQLRDDPAFVLEFVLGSLTSERSG